MSWSIEGEYFENCSCEVVCPCTVSLSLGADNDHCRVVLAFHVERGEVDGVDVGGLNLAAVADTPRYMHEGNWKLGVLIDESASVEQAEKLGAVFSGQLGGPMAALSGLVGEQLGVERVPLDFESEDGRHTLRVGGHGQAQVEDVVPFGIDTGEPAEVKGVFHPVGSELTIAKATDDSSVEVFGITFGGAGKSGFSHRFAWSG